MKTQIQENLGIYFYILGVRGRAYFWLGTHLSASLAMSSSPSNTLETSKCGSHRTKPRPGSTGKYIKQCYTVDNLYRRILSIFRPQKHFKK